MADATTTTSATQLSTTQPATIQVVLVPSTPPTPSFWSQPSLWISIVSACVAAGSFYNSWRQRRVAEAQHATAEGQRRIAEAQHVTAESQRVTASEKLRLDLFVHRMKVCIAMQNICQALSGTDEVQVEKEMLLDLHYAYRVSPFLFDKDVDDYVQNAKEAATARLHLWDRRNPTAPALNEDERATLSEQLRMKNECYFMQSWTTFRPYLDFSNIGLPQPKPVSRDVDGIRDPIVRKQ